MCSCALLWANSVSMDGDVVPGSFAEWVSERSLVVAVSYSGNTEETLDAFAAATAKRYHVVALASEDLRAERSWRKASRKHMYGMLGVAVGFGVGALVRHISWLPEYFSPCLAIVLGYLGNQIQMFINQRASQGKD